MNLDYKRLDFNQYFIDTSNDYNKTGKARFKINYIDIIYEYKKKICHADYSMHYEEDRNVIQINFEKSTGKIDWFVNFMFIDKYYNAFDYDGKPIVLKVHNGWAAMYKAMKHQIREEFELLYNKYNHPTVEIIGWSLGSGQAMLCAQDLYFNYGVKSYLYTYGSVNPFKTNIFNRRKMKKYLANCCIDIYNFCHKSDIVTYLPFRLFGFIKIRRVNVRGKFKLLGLFNPNKYHTKYDNEELYIDIK